MHGAWVRISPQQVCTHASPTGHIPCVPTPRLGHLRFTALFLRRACPRPQPFRLHLRHVSLTAAPGLACSRNVLMLRVCLQTCRTGPRWWLQGTGQTCAQCCAGWSCRFQPHTSQPPPHQHQRSRRQCLQPHPSPLITQTLPHPYAVCASLRLAGLAQSPSPFSSQWPSPCWTLPSHRAALTCCSHSCRQVRHSHRRAPFAAMHSLPSQAALQVAALAPASAPPAAAWTSAALQRLVSQGPARRPPPPPMPTTCSTSSTAALCLAQRPAAVASAPAPAQTSTHCAQRRHLLQQPQQQRPIASRQS